MPHKLQLQHPVVTGASLRHSDFDTGMPKLTDFIFNIAATQNVNKRTGFNNTYR